LNSPRGKATAQNPTRLNCQQPRAEWANGIDGPQVPAPAQQSGLRRLVFFDSRGYRFLCYHPHGFGLLGRYSCVGKRFSHSFRQFPLKPCFKSVQHRFATNLLLLRSVGLARRRRLGCFFEQAAHSGVPSGLNCGVTSRQSFLFFDPSGWHDGVASVVSLSQASYSGVPSDLNDGGIFLTSVCQVCFHTMNFCVPITSPNPATKRKYIVMCSVTMNNAILNVLPAVLRNTIIFLASASTWCTCCAVMGTPPSSRVSMSP